MVNAPPKPRLSAGVLLPALAVVFILQSCAGLPSTPPSEIIAQSERYIADAKARIAALPADDPARPKMEKAVADVEKELLAYKARIAAELARGADPDEAQAQATLQTVSGFLPPPWGSVAQVLGGVIVGGIYGIRKQRQAANLKASAEALAVGIQTVAVQNGGMIDFTDENQRDQLKAAIPEGARSLVKSAQATVPRVRTRTKPRTRKSKTTVQPATAGA
jgi:hypothetical protein